MRFVNAWRRRTSSPSSGGEIAAHGDVAAEVAGFGAQLLGRPLADHLQVHGRRDDLRGRGEVQKVGDHLAQQFRFVANPLDVTPGPFG